MNTTQNTSAATLLFAVDHAMAKVAERAVAAGATFAEADAAAFAALRNHLAEVARLNALPA